MHLICLPAASIEDRQLYLGIVPSFKTLNFSPESSFIYILVISELTGYVLDFWSSSAFPAPLAATTLHWLSPPCDTPWRLTASKAQFCNRMPAQSDTTEIPKTTDQWVFKCWHAQEDLQD